MKPSLKSDLTLDTYPSEATLHNCPSCRCRSTDHSKSFSRSFTHQGPVITTTHNLYMSKQAIHEDKTNNVNSLSRTMFRSSVFANKPNRKMKITVSPPKTQISFSYASPPKKSRSVTARFSTKKYKQSRFPHLKAPDGSPVKQVINKSGEKVYTTEDTPARPKLLQMKKLKSRQKMEITVSKKSNNSSQKSIKQPWTSNTKAPAPELQNKPYIKQEESPEQIKKPLGIYDVRLIETPRKDLMSNSGSSRQYFDQASLGMAESHLVPKPTILRPRESSNSPEREANEDMLLAKSLSEELSLNYDYYGPGKIPSDRSISLPMPL